VAIPSRVYDRKGKLIGEFYSERRTLIPVEKIPSYLISALVSSEDRKFYEHEGVRYSSIARAVIKNLLSLRYSQGGSTITQQLAKVLFTNQEKTIGRKLFELFCTNEIESRFTKKEILEMYLNLIYMGHGNYGVETAANYFFDKSAENLTLAESAMLIGLLPNPTLYSPITGLEYSLIRQKKVIDAMTEVNAITAEQATAALKMFQIQWQISKKESGYLSLIGNFPDHIYRINLAPYFLDEIKQFLLNQYTQDVISKGGLKIYTTLDVDKQLVAQKKIKDAINKQKEYYRQMLQSAGINEKKSIRISEAIERTNGVFVSIDSKDGAVLTMIGGSEFSSRNQFNRSTKAYRQIGSLIKPFIYYMAIKEKKITAATILEDSQVKEGTFDYQNYDGKYDGPMTAYDALRRSRNTIAVKLLQSLSIDDLQQILARITGNELAAIKERVPHELGVALGTPQFSPMEVAQAYASLSNNGTSVKPYLLYKIEDADGRVIWQKPEERKEKVLNSDAAFIVVNILKGVFQEGGTAGWVSKLQSDQNLIPFDIAGKTGTTSSFRDAWFAGITPDEVSIVWLGTDYNFSLGEHHTGGALGAPVWIDYITSNAREKTESHFEKNFTLNNITTESFCAESGGVPINNTSCPHQNKMAFLTGTEPSFFCPLHKTSSEPSR